MTNAEIHNLHKVKKMTKRSIARMSGMKYSEIKKILTEEPVAKIQETSLSELTQEKKDKILRLWLFGYSIHTIAQDQDVGHSVIKEIINKNSHLEKIIKKSFV